MNATEIAKFQVGKTYTCRSTCDHECVWSYTIVSRTDKTVKTACGLTLRINQKMAQHFGKEIVYPQGKFSMCPSISAS